MIKLGSQVKDPITGFEGTATARTTWLYGCDRIGVQAKKKEDGTVPELEWFDERQLENLGPDPEDPGGPQPDPVRCQDPRR